MSVVLVFSHIFQQSIEENIDISRLEFIFKILKVGENDKNDNKLLQAEILHRKFQYKRIMLKSSVSFL